MTDVLIRREEDIGMHKEKRAMQSQWRLEWCREATRKEARKNSFQEPAEETWPCLYLDFRFIAFRILKE